MELHIHIHQHYKNETEIINKLKSIQMSNEELLALLLADDAKVDKIITEIQALKDLVASTGNVPQNIVDAINSLGTKLQAADDLNADA